jgi:hypothetical protein
LSGPNLGGQRIEDVLVVAVRRDNGSNELRAEVCRRVALGIHVWRHLATSVPGASNEAGIGHANYEDGVRCRHVCANEIGDPWQRNAAAHGLLSADLANTPI